MASTNSTNKGYLNKNKDKDGVTQYAYQIYVNTGNMADKTGTVKNGKYVSTRIFNKTYTLQTYKYSFEESGLLLNYNDPIGRDNGYTAVYGHPDKWVYDTQQRYQNCGIATALNILSIAGKIDIVEPTAAEKSKYSKPYTVTTKKVVDPWTGETETTTKTIYPKVDFTSSEEKLTLYAIQHDYCSHSRDLENYKTVKDIKWDDGGTSTEVIYSEENLYHDTTTCISNILNDYGVKAHVDGLCVDILPSSIETVQYINEGTEDTHIEIDDDGNPQEVTEIIPKHEVYYVSANSNYINYYEIDDAEHGDNDTIIFNDVKSDDSYVICEDNRDVIIAVGRTQVRIKNYYPDEDAEVSKITGIQFSDGSSTSINSYINANHTYYSTAYLNSNILTYGSDITTLLQFVQDGKGMALFGYGYGLIGGKGGGHVITLVGGQKTLFNDFGTNKYSGHYLSSYSDITGFYVVDTGGFLGKGAQLISCERLYNFLTNTKYNDTGIFGTDKVNYIITDNNIKKWADKLNLYGNERRNSLIGNDSANIIKGFANADNLYGMGGNDTMYGGTGNDWISGGGGSNKLYGGTGNDTYVFSVTDTKGAKQYVYCGAGKDNLRFEGLGNPVDFQGEPNPDYVHLLASSLKYYNSNGHLLIKYKNLDDETCTVNLVNYFKKGLYSKYNRLDDNETIQKRALDNKNHSYDFLKLVKTAGVNYTLSTEGANSKTGTKIKDIFHTTKYNDTINAMGGSDIIYAEQGNDVIKGGTGNDKIYSQYGNKKIYGQGGNDSIIYKDNYSGYDTIYSGTGYDHVELADKTRGDLLYSKKGNNLVVTYDQTTGAGFTVTNYFSKKGKTSVGYIKLKDGDYLDLVREYKSEILPNYVKNKKVTTTSTVVNGGKGHDTLTSGSGNDVIKGGMGDDIIKGGKGNDTITGGLGCDKLYGQGGSNTFIYETMYDGVDTIYGSGAGQIVVDMSSIADLNLNGTIGFEDGYEFFNNGDKNYAFTKSGNDLLINYGKTIDQRSMSRIRLSNYFKSKNKYSLVTASGTLDIKKATVFFEGKKSKSNKITGSKQNDLIYGGTKADTIKGGSGSDTIIAGKGNDVITGGTGHNRILYNLGNGKETINLTKNENLDIVLNDGMDSSKLSYKIYKKDLLIKYKGTTILNLKNFGKKDVTTSKGSVNLFIGDTKIHDLRMDLYVPTYSSFSSKKLKYTGTWHSERINASKLVKKAIDNKKGVTINAGAGNDIITGSKYNDTINGGYGKDTITGGAGKNTLNGGKGNDTYILFNNVSGENSTIKDSGSTTADTALIYTAANKLKVWFNITNKGKITKFFHINSTDGKSNKTTLKGVDVIKSATDNATYNYKSDALRSEVAAWLNNSSHKYSDVNTAFEKATINQKNELIAIFNKSDYWTTT